ncbi:ABC transporter permease [Actinokineospora enzanensis]|uniref:ABC transporter permease n=1 Tax=Actinokineospora enzanensis TaxID=155975 RepID=UPI00037B73F8|nr:ABC transporter permease [Actinokineospora enzanensis]
MPGKRPWYGIPDWLITLSHVSPTSYGASAIRQVVLGPVTGRLWLDVGVLALVTAMSLWLVGHKLPWHQK